MDVVTEISSTFLPSGKVVRGLCFLHLFFARSRACAGLGAIKGRGSRTSHEHTIAKQCECTCVPDVLCPWKYGQETSIARFQHVMRAGKTERMIDF